MFVFLLLALGVSCILPVCSGTPFKLPFSNISLCFCLSKKKKFSLVGVFLILLLYFFFLSIFSFVVSYQKKKKKRT